jgi:hypothetical protein
MGMSAGPSGGEAVAVAKGEDKASLLQRLRQQVRSGLIIARIIFSQIISAVAARARGARTAARETGAVGALQDNICLSHASLC